MSGQSPRLGVAKVVRVNEAQRDVQYEDHMWCLTVEMRDVCKESRWSRLVRSFEEVSFSFLFDIHVRDPLKIPLALQLYHLESITPQVKMQGEVGV
ncbi:hypothetical protein RJT34_19474 [Clitoria ternatea]|uniref:Uncharacterized protein n=1 Tax=Clitoria ternatea TaxID=43366 RepID=A0AAN9IR42_CLITE